MKYEKLSPPLQQILDVRTKSIEEELRSFQRANVSDTSSHTLSLARVFSAMGKGGDGLASTPYYETFKRIAEQSDKPFNPFRIILPFEVLAGRALATTPGAKGGYVIGADVGDVADILRPFSVTARMGVQVMTGLKNNFSIPVTKTRATATWQGSDGTSVTAADPVLGSASLAQKTVIAITTFSVQLMNQAASVEDYLRQELLRTVGNAIDRAAIRGLGGSEPLGLLSHPDVQTQSGTTLNAGTLTMKKLAAEANASDEQISFLSTPAVRALLEARERATGGGRFVWDNDQVADRRAYVSTDVPASTLICGDWSTCILGIWGQGITVEIDPHANFNAGGMAARVVVSCDFCALQSSSFIVATSIT